MAKERGIPGESDDANLSIVRADNGGETIRLTWSDGTADAFHAIWLRDNCTCPQCRHPDNDQRLFDVTDLPHGIIVTSATLGGDGALEVTFGPDGHCSRFEPVWLRRYVNPVPGTERRLWGQELSDSLPVSDFRQAAKDPKALAGWLEHLATLGLAILTNVPRESGAVTRVAEVFGHVRETNYGRLFDVRAEPDPTNLAFTGLGLPVHTDNPYRDPVPGLQLLHCLDADAEGGDTVVVDGFNAAETLRRESPEAFSMLSQHSVPFRFRDGTVDLQARAPFIELNAAGALRAVRYNNRSVAPFDLSPEVLPGFYAAYRRFAEILQQPQLQVSFCLEPGNLFIVDNERVLHGRRGYEGQRHLQGCYADKDALHSRRRLLKASGAKP